MSVPRMHSAVLKTRQLHSALQNPFQEPSKRSQTTSNRHMMRFYDFWDSELLRLPDVLTYKIHISYFILHTSCSVLPFYNAYFSPFKCNSSNSSSSTNSGSSSRSARVALTLGSMSCGRGVRVPSGRKKIIGKKKYYKNRAIKLALSRPSTSRMRVRTTRTVPKNQGFIVRTLAVIEFIWHS